MGELFKSHSREAREIFSRLWPNLLLLSTFLFEKLPYLDFKKIGRTFFALKNFPGEASSLKSFPIPTKKSKFLNHCCEYNKNIGEAFQGNPGKFFKILADKNAILITFFNIWSHIEKG